MKSKEFREWTVDELRVRKREMREEIFKLRLQQRSGQLEKPSMLRTLRRNIARIQTVISEKLRAANQTVST
ncbi:MAG: 50S ribosomal protein L29 [Verrucomicrobia bacterium]|nr:MAG: 50S ribosomal protein L29 [Verrucomicrobiota bacterium]